MTQLDPLLMVSPGGRVPRLLEDLEEQARQAERAPGVDQKFVPYDDRELRQMIKALTHPLQGQVWRSTNQSINNNAATAISFDTEVHDHGDMVDISGAATRITFPKAGVYLIAARMKWATDADGTRFASVREGGANTLATGTSLTSAIFQSYHNITLVHSFAYREYIELIAYHTEGAPLNVLSTADESPYLSAHWIGEA